MTTLYPKLPGFIINHNPTQDYFKKTSSVKQDQIKHGETYVKKSLPLPRQNAPEQINLRHGLSTTQSTYTNHFGPEIIEHFQPDYVKLDKQVLRFFGYFKESVVELKKENARIRKMIIYYYLVDDTISIIDTRQTNSGIMQGAFLKRGKVLKEGNNFYTFNDFSVGADLYVYGKYIKLYDCDQYTREFYQGLGVQQPENIDVPLDSFTAESQTSFVPKRDNLMKNYLEHRLGGGKVTSQKQFLENDRKVLRFNAKFESLKYIIHYYLADDTVEIRELHSTNSGRDLFPVFLKRNKLPRKFSVVQPGEVGDSDFYKAADIEPFMTLWAYNRPFKILGCDEFTAEFFFRNYGKNFPIGGFEDPPMKQKSNIIIPPHNGFGSEEDSLGNCLRLQNKPPVKDYFKYIDNDKIILRFLARLNTDIPEDMGRRFLFSFFMADDTIQVYEVNNKNSGIWEGKFLERSRYKNIENDSKYFNISDFQIEKSMKINSFSLHILDADDFTKKWMSDNLK